MTLTAPRKEVPPEKKVMISLLSAMVFYIIANPHTYRLTRNIFGKWVASSDGCATKCGVALHTGVFFLVTLMLMNIPKKN